MLCKETGWGLLHIFSFRFLAQSFYLLMQKMQRRAIEIDNNESLSRGASAKT
jgi:hypothetical protein